MKRLKLFFVVAIAFYVQAQTASAQSISEFEPNPAGGDPAMQQVEITGTAGSDFDFWILSLENDGFDGTVDRATNVVGTFNAEGFAAVTIGDLENPSNTVVLTDSFTGAVGDDLDANDDGNLDLSSLGTIFDAVGVSDVTGDDASLYGEILGGTNILFNGEFEPLSVFRDGTTGEFFQTVTADFGGANERLAVFAANPSQEFDASNFDLDPFTTTFGFANPSFTAIPEPSSIGLIAIAVAGLTFRRRK